MMIVRSPAGPGTVPAIVAPMQSITPAACVQVNAPPPGAASTADTNVTPTGSVSRTATLSAAPVPALETSSRYVIVPPGVVDTVLAGAASKASVRSLNDPLPPFRTTVWADALLSNSLPSTMAWSGSTSTWLMYVPGVSGANAVRVIVAPEAVGV